MTIEQINKRKPINSILTALSFCGFRESKSGNKLPLINVFCKCGTIKIIEAYDLSRGKTRSCGCTRKINCNHSKYSVSINRLHNIWGSMNHRCYNDKDKAYKYYGGKGITVCKEWRNNYQVFLDWSLLNGYDENLTIDRIDNNIGYEPNNCRWVTLKKNCNNRSTCIYITHNEITLTLQEWSELLNINRDKLKDKLFNKGYSINDFINENTIMPI